MSKVKLLFPFILIFCLTFSLNKTNTALSIIFAVAVHEIGHISAIYMLKGKIIRNSVFGMGADIEYTQKELSIKSDIIVYISGPLAGMLGAIIGQFLGLYSFALYSTTLSIVNLIPAYPLDGGNILKSILPADKCDNLILIISFVIGCIICILGLAIIFVSGNFSVFSLGMSILVSIIPKRTLQ